MGGVLQKMVQLGEYCDCLQNWRKFTQSHEETSSNLYISENLSNIELPLQKVFEPEKVQNGLDRQLEVMHERLNRRKRLKAEYIKQKQKQRIFKQKQEQRIQQQNIQRIKRKQQIIHEEEVRRIQQQEAQKLKRYEKEKKIGANKRNNKQREIEREKARLDDFVVTIPTKQLSTTDENIFNLNENNSLNEENQQQQNFYQVDQEKQQSQEQSQERSQKHKESQKSQKRQQDVKLELEDQLDISEIHHPRQKDKGLEVIDLSKLDPLSIKDEISELVFKKLSQRATSQTVPLYPKTIQTHRVVGNKMGSIFSKKGHLQYEHKEQHQFQEDQIQFGESQILRQNTASYFLDDEDKKEYFRVNKN